MRKYFPLVPCSLTLPYLPTDGEIRTGDVLEPTRLRQEEFTFRVY